MKNILLADYHPVVRMGIKTLINKTIPYANIDEAGTELEIIRSVKFTHYDLISLDVHLPDTDFCKLMQWITIVSPTSNLLIFTWYAEELYGLRCIQLGAKGFLTKTAENDEVESAFRKVLNGEKYINHKLAALLAERCNDKHIDENPFDILSQREMEITTYLNDGRSLPEISAIMKIQYSTANTYKRRIFDKLGVRNILELSRLIQVYR